MRALQPAARAASAPPPAGAASGSEYLRARLAGARTVAALHEPLAALAVAARCWPERAPGELLRSSYLDPFAPDLRRLDEAVSRRIDADPDNVERGLAQLVLTIIELLRQLMERQALRRVEAGGLDAETIERLGGTLMALEARMEELKQTFGLRDEDLNLDLGPLGRLL
jgi:hypothetical protein